MVCHFFISIKEADWGECEVHGVKAVEGELHIWFAKQRKEKTNKENDPPQALTKTDWKRLSHRTFMRR